MRQPVFVRAEASVSMAKFVIVLINLSGVAALIYLSIRTHSKQDVLSSESISIDAPHAKAKLGG
jgi:hypothetical protein